MKLPKPPAAAAVTLLLLLIAASAAMLTQGNPFISTPPPDTQAKTPRQTLQPEHTPQSATQTVQNTPRATIPQENILQPSPTTDGASTFRVPTKVPLKYPNLGSRLDRLAQDVGPPGTPDPTVNVTIHLSHNMEDVTAFLQEHHIPLANTGKDYIEAQVPASLLGPLSLQTGVIRIREASQPHQPTSR